MSIFDFDSFVPLRDLKPAIEAMVTNPSAIQEIVLNNTAAIADGVATAISPASPLIWGLEIASVITSASVTESRLLLNKQYAELAQTEDDLYRHLAEPDFLNLFGSPARAWFTFAIQYDDLLGKLVPVPGTRYSQVKIPRNTAFTADDGTTATVFTLQYPVVIRRYDTGVLEITYDVTTPSPVQRLPKELIAYKIQTDPLTRISWLRFLVAVLQCRVSTNTWPLDNLQTFRERLPLTDNFYTARVFFQNADNQPDWSELAVSFTKDVYDPNVPTALLAVIDNRLEVTIPSLYLRTNQVSGSIRLDWYETKGNISLGLNLLPNENFSCVLQALDEVNDLDDYTDAMANVQFGTRCQEAVVGGSNGLDFATVRDRVVSGRLGGQAFPITDRTLQNFGEEQGFNLFLYIDNLTRRVYLASRDLPSPQAGNLIVPADLGLGTVLFTPGSLTRADIFRNGARITLPSNLLYQTVNGVTSLLSLTESQALKSLGAGELIATMAVGTYTYSPFYHVLDSSRQDFNVRIYELDHPTADESTFIEQNASLTLRADTQAYAISKTATGYRLQIVTFSDSFYQELPDAVVGVYLGFYPPNESSLALLPGTLAATANGERSFVFEITTNHDLDANDRLILTNFAIYTAGQIPLAVDLAETFHLIYTTTSVTDNYTPGPIDALLNNSIVPAGTVGISHNSVQLTFGVALTNLWTGARTVATGLEYATYTEDVPLVYETDQYASTEEGLLDVSLSPAGDLVYTKLHSQNDPVLDAQGAPILRHRQGDIIFDPSGQPVIKTAAGVGRLLDIVLLDGVYYFANSPLYQSYRDELTLALRAIATTALEPLLEVLVEKSELYFYPNRKTGLIPVQMTDGNVVHIEAQLSFSITLTVTETANTVAELKAKLDKLVRSTFRAALASPVVSETSINRALELALGGVVDSFTWAGLPYPRLAMVNASDRVSVAKRLVIDASGVLVVEDAIAIDYLVLAATTG